MMRETWRVEVWGVRGSIPVPEADHLEYGGNTSCISAELGEELLIFDAGSGLAKLGARLRQQGRKRADLLLGHLHIDHLIGLFGFPLLFDPQAEVHLYGRTWDESSLSERLEGLVGRPYWPLSLKDFPAHVEVHEIEEERAFRLAGREAAPEGIVISAIEGAHPGKSLLYRVEAEGRSIVHALDCETDDVMFEKLKEHCQGAELLIWDASFSEDDRFAHPGWGHSSWVQGAALQKAAGVKKVLMTHYAWDYTDQFLREQERLAERAGGALCFAKEGMVIEV